MAKAEEMFLKGNIQSARKHWAFAANDVAPHARSLNPKSDGLHGNVQLWREGVATMTQLAHDRLAGRQPKPARPQGRAGAAPQPPTPAARPSNQPSQNRSGNAGASLASTAQRPQGGAAHAQPPRSSGNAALEAAVEADALVDKPDVKWAEVVGLEGAKQALQEAVVLPTIRSDLFRGIRSPDRGILLYGPPGNGKTLLARAAAAAASAAFLAVSASALTSKWHGEAEKLVRALFAVARKRAPTIIFLDEVDSMLGERSAGEHEASRRLKTEFLVQMDGASGDNSHVLVLAATNRPQDLDSAVIRRLPRRIYIPLPDEAARTVMIRKLLDGVSFRLSREEMRQVAAATELFSASDLKALCHEAAMGPLREHGGSLATVNASRLRHVALQDFTAALVAIRPSVTAAQVRQLEEWSRGFGVSG
eukprot:jgi/Ulvmu1/11654/UM008_0058.1